MKLSISSLAWSADQSEIVREILLKSAVRHIDTVPLHVVKSLDAPHEPEIQNFMNFWSSSNFKVIGLQSLFYEKSNLCFFKDDVSCEKAVSHFQKVTSLAQRLEAGALVFGSPKQRRVFEKHEQIVDNFFNKLSFLCRGQKFCLCIEPNSVQYGTNFLVNTHETAEFIFRLGQESVMMNFDTGCDIMNNEDPVESFEKNHKIVGHVHLSSPHLGPVKQDTMDHAAMARSLKRVNFRGGVAIEMIRDPDNEKSLENLRDAIQVLQSHYA